LPDLLLFIKVKRRYSLSNTTFVLPDQWCRFLEPAESTLGNHATFSYTPTFKTLFRVIYHSFIQLFISITPISHRHRNGHKLRVRITVSSKFFIVNYLKKCLMLNLFNSLIILSMIECVLQFDFACMQFVHLKIQDSPSKGVRK